MDYKKNQLLEKITKTKVKVSSSWLLKCQEWKEKYPVVLKDHRTHRGSVSTYYFSEVLADELSNNDLIVPGSSGNCVEIFYIRVFYLIYLFVWCILF